MSLEHQEQYERDGVAYQIFVIREEGSLWGEWYCPICDEKGGSSKACSSTEDAVQVAQVNTGTHHATKHLR